MVFPDVFVSKLEVDDDFATQVASLKLSVEDTIHVLKVACSMEFAILKFTLIIKTRLRRPFIVSFSVELSILKLSFIKVSVLEVQLTLTVEYIGEELPLVHNFATGFGKP